MLPSFEQMYRVAKSGGTKALIDFDRQYAADPSMRRMIHIWENEPWNQPGAFKKSSEYSSFIKSLYQIGYTLGKPYTDDEERHARIRELFNKFYDDMNRLPDDDPARRYANRKWASYSPDSLFRNTTGLTNGYAYANRYDKPRTDALVNELKSVADLNLTPAAFNGLNYMLTMGATHNLPEYAQEMLANYATSPIYLGHFANQMLSDGRYIGEYKPYHHATWVNPARIYGASAANPHEDFHFLDDIENTYNHMVPASNPDVGHLLASLRDEQVYAPFLTAQDKIADDLGIYSMKDVDMYDLKKKYPVLNDPWYRKAADIFKGIISRRVGVESDSNNAAMDRAFNNGFHSARYWADDEIAPTEYHALGTDLMSDPIQYKKLKEKMPVMMPFVDAWEKSTQALSDLYEDNMSDKPNKPAVNYDQRGTQPMTKPAYGLEHIPEIKPRKVA